MSNSDSNLAFRTIDALRFPLMVCVVLIHTVIVSDNTSYKLFCHLVEFVTNSAVPAFFLFSGFLFFREGYLFSLKNYAGKLHRRVRTLLIPYFFWNGVVLVRFYFTQHFIGISNDGLPLIADFTAIEWLRAFWDLYGGNPICFQFWFIRDLMVIVLLSPILFLLLNTRYIKWVFLLSVFVFWILQIPSPPGLSLTSVLYFSLGAMFSINGYNLTDLAQRLIKPMLVILTVFLVLDIIPVDSLFSSIPFVQLSILPVILLALGIVSKQIERGSLKVNKELTDSNFFIYATHPILVAPLHHLIAKTLYPTLGITWIALYAGITALIIFVLYYSYRLLKTLLPQFTAVITGGR